MGTNVHKRIPRGRKQGLRWDGNGVKKGSVTADPTLTSLGSAGKLGAPSIASTPCTPHNLDENQMRWSVEVFVK